MKNYKSTICLGMMVFGWGRLQPASVSQWDTECGLKNNRRLHKTNTNRSRKQMWTLHRSEVLAFFFCLFDELYEWSKQERKKKHHKLMCRWWQWSTQTKEFISIFFSSLDVFHFNDAFNFSPYCHRGLRPFLHLA